MAVLQQQKIYYKDGVKTEKEFFSLLLLFIWIYGGRHLDTWVVKYSATILFSHSVILLHIGKSTVTLCTDLNFGSDAPWHENPINH